MKTIESLDFPLRVYFKDGECHHDSAVIVFTHGAPAYVRASGPFVVYPWENIKHIIRVADEAQGDGLMGKHKVLREENIRLHKLHTDKRLALHKALGLLDSEELDHAALCERVAMMREWRDSAGHPAVAQAARLQLDLASMTEQRDLLKRQLEELRAETRKPAPSQPKQVEPGGPIWVRVVDTSSKEFGRVGRLADIEVLRRGPEEWTVDLDDVTRVTWPSTMFVLAGTGRPREEHMQVTVTKHDTEHQQAQNRDKWRATCLANGAKDCTVYFGPGDEVTFVVELQRPCQSAAKALDAMRQALLKEHGLHANDYRLREVRPLVDGGQRLGHPAARRSQR